MENQNDVEQSELAKTWKDFALAATKLGLSVSNVSLSQLIKQLKPNEAFYYIKGFILECWWFLKQKYPNILLECSLTDNNGKINDSGILDIVESAHELEIQHYFLIIFVQLTIEVEGWELEYEKIRITQEQKKLDIALKSKD